MNALIVFLKYPEPGKVKSRLAREIGEEAAAETYKKMVASVLATVDSMQDPRLDTFIYFSPAEKKQEVSEWLGPQRTMRSQKGASLGERMKNAFQEVFDGGAEHAVIIGTDCIEITPEIIEQAFSQLELVSKDVVIGPALDGGYYLLGMSRFIPQLFDGIEWSTKHVYRQTCEIVDELHLSRSDLPTLRDIDRVEDLAGFDHP